MMMLSGLDLYLNVTEFFSIDKLIEGCNVFIGSTFLMLLNDLALNM